MNTSSIKSVWWNTLRWKWSKTRSHSNAQSRSVDILMFIQLYLKEYSLLSSLSDIIRRHYPCALIQTKTSFGAQHPIAKEQLSGQIMEIKRVNPGTCVRSAIKSTVSNADFHIIQELHVNKQSWKSSTILKMISYSSISSKMRNLSNVLNATFGSKERKDVIPWSVDASLISVTDVAKIRILVIIDYNLI